MAGFLERFGVTVDRDRMRAMKNDYMQTTPSRDMIVAGVEELVETAGSAMLMGALEQRYGEQKTTLFMSDKLDSTGAPMKDLKTGDNIKKPGTGLPYSAAGAILGVTVSALVPMTPAWRRRTLNVATGLGSAWSYRKGIELGQKWLDKANKVPEGTTGNESGIKDPGPPYTTSSQSIAGELGQGASVVSLVDRANEILARKLANNG